MNACGDSRLRGLRSRKPIGFRQWVVHSATNHVIGKGNLIAEIQQNSNVIYCVYDYGRVGKDGKKRAQHNKKAFAVETIKSEKIKLGCFYVV